MTNTALLAVALLLLAAVPLVAPVERADVATRGDLADGWRFLRGHPVLRSITWTSALLAAVDAAWFALLVLIAGQQLGLGPAGFGVLLAVGAVGGLAGAGFADRLGAVRLERLAAVVVAPMGAVLLVFSLAPGIATGTLAMVVTSAGFALWNVRIATARQRATPDALLGRVTSTFRLVVVTAAMIGAALGAAVAGTLTLTTTIGGAGIILLLATPAVATGHRRAG
jgi:predicted MFS family arabinose efflux permease